MPSEQTDKILLRHGLQRGFYLGTASLCLLLGTAGLILPLLPTTPFILLALWLASRGSPRFEHWIKTHPRFSSMIQIWQQQRAIPLRAKFIACLLLLTSALTLYFTLESVPLLLITGCILLLAGSFILTRPTASSAPSQILHPAVPCDTGLSGAGETPSVAVHKNRIFLLHGGMQDDPVQ